MVSFEVIICLFWSINLISKSPGLPLFHEIHTPPGLQLRSDKKTLTNLFRPSPPPPPQKKKKSVGNPKLPICLSPTEIRENLWSLRPNKIVSYLRGRGGGGGGGRGGSSEQESMLTVKSFTLIQHNNTI